MHGPLAGIVQVDLVLAEALDHEEVVEVPVHDDRHRQLAHLVRLLAEAARLEPVLARGLEHVAGLAAVARDAALLAQPRERDEGAVVLEHDRERGGAALGRLHLQARGRVNPLAAALLGALASATYLPNSRAGNTSSIGAAFAW